MTLRYRGHLRQATGVDTEQVQAQKVADALRYIRRTYGAKTCKQAKAMMIVVDGESISMRQRYNTPLAEGALLSFLPLCGGG